ncbi:MAG: DUF11 domain-containing protein [Pedobacter sp.]|nr:MAG: DUF11 domain-containing protein [Pedobacter sp.]
MFQTDTEGPVIWLDNVRLQEGVAIQNNPDDFIKLYYNPTLRDSTVVLPTGAFRDVKNQAYANSFVLRPFTSVVLLRDTVAVPAADLSLSLDSDKRVVKVNELVSMRLRVRNEGNTKAELARWTYRLPANNQFVEGNGQAFQDNVLTGTVFQLNPQADTTFSITVRPTAPGLFRMTAQLTTATSHDSDSKPNSGTGDGEDDASTAELVVGGVTSAVFESPNPNQRLLPAVSSNQPASDGTKADLSLRLVVGKRALSLGELVSFTVNVANVGGLAADGVQIQNVLPEGVELVSATNWTVSGRTMTTTLPAIPANTTASASFQVRVTTLGHWINQAQINTSSVGDPDSTPGNGFINGEDDQAQVDIRVR